MENSVKIKVCGMTRPDNLRCLASLPVDLVGLIFAARSPRAVGPRVPRPPLPAVGVFLDEDPARVASLVSRHGLHAVQLHGGETPVYCRALHGRGALVIKTIHVATVDDLRVADDYHGVVDYLLFDTRTCLPGGSGQKFDWGILQAYRGPTPFFLGGGIGPGDAPALRQLAHPALHAIDINSRFEIAPGLKDIPAIQRFIQELRAPAT